MFYIWATTTKPTVFPVQQAYTHLAVPTTQIDSAICYLPGITHISGKIAVNKGKAQSPHIALNNTQQRQ